MQKRPREKYWADGESRDPRPAPSGLSALRSRDRYVQSECYEQQCGHCRWWSHLRLGDLRGSRLLWQQADVFWEYLLSFVQGFFWPAWMVYEILRPSGVDPRKRPPNPEQVSLKPGCRRFGVSCRGRAPDSPLRADERRAPLPHEPRLPNCGNRFTDGPRALGGRIELGAHFAVQSSSQVSRPPVSQRRCLVATTTRLVHGAPILLV